jgi:hypothetical protein
MDRLAASNFLFGLGLGVALAWILEANTIGVGIISIYLAPVACIAPIIAAALRKG